jgi:hypothetical protein
MLGMSTALLDAAKRGDLRRGREQLQLDLAYPWSSLSLSFPGTPARTQGLHAGDRAPDAPVQGAGGQPVRLFTLFQGPHWTLLGQDVEPGVAERLRCPGLHIYLFGERGDLVDVSGHFQQAYGLARGEMVLVRPDGYVAAIAGQADGGALGDYLRRVGLRRGEDAPA